MVRSSETSMTHSADRSSSVSTRTGSGLPTDTPKASATGSGATGATGATGTTAATGTTGTTGAATGWAAWGPGIPSPGIHQFHRPSSRIDAGTMTSRTSVASMAIATAI